MNHIQLYLRHLSPLDHLRENVFAIYILRVLNSASEPQKHIVGSFSMLSAISNNRLLPGNSSVRENRHVGRNKLLKYRDFC